MTTATIIGLWVAAFLTLCIFSFLAHDNPFYKLAEHLFVGVSAAYSVVISFQNVVRPNLINKLANHQWIYLVPLALGVMLVMRLVPRLAWVSRFPLAFMVGTMAGYQAVVTTEAQIIKQISATTLPLWVPGSPADTLFNLIVVGGVLCGLVYFFFSIEHDAPIVRQASTAGIYVLMITFGAGFGYTVMARVSLLIGRLMFFRYDFWPAVQALLGGGG